MVFGTPCRRTIFLKNKVAICDTSFVLLQGIKCAILEKRSTTTNMESLPFLVRGNGKWNIKTMRVGRRLSFETFWAAKHKAFHVSLHSWPIVTCWKHCICVVPPKMSHEAASMWFLQKQQAKRRLRDTKFVSFKQETLVQIEIIKTFVTWALGSYCSIWSYSSWCAHHE